MNKETWPTPDDAQDELKHEGESITRKSSISRWIKTGLVAAGSLVGFGAGEEHNAEAQTPQPTQSIAQKFEAAGGTATDLVEKVIGSGWDWNIYHTFFKKDSNGNEVFNPGALIAPFAFVGTKESKTAATASIAVPYEYARLYDNAKSLDPEAGNKMQEYIKQQLLNSFGEQVHNYGFFLTDGVLQSKRQIDTGFGQIRSVSIKGYSSPEGGNPESLIPGNVEIENTDLAVSRAEDVLNMLPEEIPEGTPLNTLEGVETQFTDEELRELDGLSTTYVFEKYGPARSAGIGMPDINYANIFEMIKDYNAGKLAQTAPRMQGEVDEVLNRLVQAKRNVQMEVEGEHSKKETYVIPIPLALLLFLLPFRRRRSVPVPTPYPLPPANLIAEPLPFPTTPENSDSGEYWIARYQTLRDLYEAFDNSEALALGINYRLICEQVDENFDRFRSHEDRITWISHQVLEQWATCDAKKMDINVNELVHKYKDDPKQLFFALLHARELNDAVVDIRAIAELTDGHDLGYTDIIFENYLMAHNEIADAVAHPRQH